jgi:hypothetical protein
MSLAAQQLMFVIGISGLSEQRLPARLQKKSEGNVGLVVEAEVAYERAARLDGQHHICVKTRPRGVAPETNVMVAKAPAHQIDGRSYKAPW